MFFFSLPLDFFSSFLLFLLLCSSFFLVSLIISFSFMFHETSWLYGWVCPSLQSCDRNWVHWLKYETDLNPQPGAEWVAMLCLPTHYYYHMLKVAEETCDCCCCSDHSPVIFLSFRWLSYYLIITYNLIIQSTLSSIQVNLKFGEVLDAFEDT